MEKGIKSKNQVRRLRWFALGCLAGVAGMWAVCAIGLRVNGTGSEPVNLPGWRLRKSGNSKTGAPLTMMLVLVQDGPLSIMRSQFSHGPGPRSRQPKDRFSAEPSLHGDSSKLEAERLPHRR